VGLALPFTPRSRRKHERAEGEEGRHAHDPGGPDRQTGRLSCVKMRSVEIVSGAEIGRRLGVSREAVRLWRQRPEFPAPVGRVGKAVAWEWEDVRRWAEDTPRRASDRWGVRRG
jgi:predicted DNA-binding transcriptional regulator AlpA